MFPTIQVSSGCLKGLCQLRHMRIVIERRVRLRLISYNSSCDFCFQKYFKSFQKYHNKQWPTEQALIFAFFRRARASARRAWTASHARREGREKNNACPPTIVHAIPLPDIPSNNQPITAFDKSGAKRSVMFRGARNTNLPF